MVFRVPDKTSRVCVCQASRTSARPLTCPLDLVAPALMASGWLLLLVETDAIVSALPASTRIYALACRLLQLPVVIASALLRANLNGPVVRQSARPLLVCYSLVQQPGEKRPRAATPISGASAPLAAAHQRRAAGQ